MKVRLIIDKTDYLQGLADRLRLRKDPNNDLEWNDIALYMSEQTGVPVAKEYCRKGAPLFYLFDEAGWVRNPDNDDGVESTYLRQKLEADKAAIKARDERNELARIQRELARRESILDTVKEGMSTYVEPMVGYVQHEIQASDNDLIVHLTDLHVGIEIDNYFNKFNTDILGNRLSKYLAKIDEVRQRHNSENCFVVLGGDCVSGLIHSNLRLENNLNIIEQVKTACVAISEFVSAICNMFGNVYVSSVAGNHGRSLPKKEDNLKGENLDCLVPFYLRAALQNYDNLFVFENKAEESVSMFIVRGNNVFSVHGDLDHPGTVVQKLTMMFGVKPDIVMAGHRHHQSVSTVYDTKIIESGCVSGVDNYCLDKRLRNKPEQSIAVVSDSGIECVYNVVLD